VFAPHPPNLAPAEPGRGTSRSPGKISGKFVDFFHGKESNFLSFPPVHGDKNDICEYRKLLHIKPNMF